MLVHKILFTAFPTEQLMIIHNESICLKFPNSTPRCNFNYTSLFLSISHECNIRIHPKTSLWKYNCYRSFNHFYVHVNTTASEVCLSNWNLKPNGTVVLFMCMDKCLQHNCKAIHHYVSSYEILRGNFLH